jgi:ribulose-5-phosphate 4-epimerase/fuculose-1-phosphate aldolase
VALLATDAMRSSLDAQRQARVDLAAALRLAALFGFEEGVCNHFTVMVSGEKDRFFLPPYGLHWSEVKASDLLVVDFDGRVISGSGTADESALCIHAPVHRLHPHATCILHTHMPFATSLAMLEDPHLIMAGQNALMFKDIIVYDEHYEGIADDRSEGERLARVLGQKSVLIMANHGVLVVERTIAKAFEGLYYLERACQAQIYALSTGRKLKSIPDAISAKTAKKIGDASRDGKRSELHFSAWKRMLDRHAPGYAD